MTPRYFHIMPWSRKPYGTSLQVSSLVASGGSPTTFEKELTFKIGYDGSTWHDVIMAESGVILFSQSTRQAIESDDLEGARFIEAPIVEVLSDQLKKRPKPKYYRLLAEGLVEVDTAALTKPRRRVPVGASGPERCDFYHVHYPKGAGGYFCSLRAVETFRRHKLKNFYIKPMDYSEDPSGPLAPPFRIKLNERKWPPKAWYPEGFVPHPNNLVDE